MAPQLSFRRPSNPVLLAISGGFVLLIILFQATRHNVQSTSTSFLGGNKGYGSAGSGLIDDIYNNTLGVSRNLPFYSAMEARGLWSSK
jgi:hypothetical protein